MTSHLNAGRPISFGTEQQQQQQNNESPTRRPWALRSLGPTAQTPFKKGKNLMTNPVLDRAARLKALEGKRDLAAALALFDALPPVTVEEMIGSWRGSTVETGNPLDGSLEANGWRGKRFDGPDLAHPLVFEDARGVFSVDPAGVMSSTASQHSDLSDPKPSASDTQALLRQHHTTDPKARLRMMEYRGVVTGTMSYDALPINDHFRKIDDDTLLGAMDQRDVDAPFIFLLRRDASQALH